jgi:hypothetical protein
VPEQQSLGQLDVMTPLNPHPGPQQGRIDLTRRSPDPPDTPGCLPRPHSRPEITDRLPGTIRAPVRQQRLKQPAPGRPRNHRYQHTAIMPPPTDNFPTPRSFFVRPAPPQPHAGGLLYGAVVWRSPGQVRLTRLVVALGLSLAVAGLSTNLLVLVALVGVTGLFISPTLTTAYLIADDAAAPGARVQAGTWVNTAYNLANSLGAALIGLLLGSFSLPVCFAITAAPAVAVAVLTLGTTQRSLESPVAR